MNRPQSQGVPTTRDWLLAAFADGAFWLAVLLAYLWAVTPARGQELELQNKKCSALCRKQPERWPISDKEKLTMGLYESLNVDSSEIGKKYGGWTQIGPSFVCTEGKWRLRRAVCVCDCGRVGAVLVRSLRDGSASRCNLCRMKDFRRVTHGLSKYREYKVWQMMIRRCTVPGTRGYENYGGRGICVCDDWRDSVERFIADMGFRPDSGYEIDRIDNDGNYEPGNCRWVPKKTNSNNRRSTRKFVFRGEMKAISEIAEESCVSRSTLAARLLHGWDAEKAASTPAVVGRNQFSC